MPGQRNRNNWLLWVLAFCFALSVIIVSYLAIKLGERVQGDAQSALLLSQAAQRKSLSVEEYVKKYLSQPLEQGARGYKGDVGPVGPKGDTGETGAQGEQGTPGYGYNGSDGTNGINGTDGSDGKSPEFRYDGSNGHLQYRYKGDDEYVDVPVECPADPSPNMTMCVER